MESEYNHHLGGYVADRSGLSVHEVIDPGVLMCRPNTFDAWKQSGDLFKLHIEPIEDEL